MQQLADRDYQKFINDSQIPVIVCFTAPWCGPCKALKSHLERLSHEFKDQVHIVSINVDDSPNVTGKFGIRSVPTMIAFVDSIVVDSSIGFKTESSVREFIANVIGVLK